MAYQSIVRIAVAVSITATWSSAGTLGEQQALADRKEVDSMRDELKTKFPASERVQLSEASDEAVARAIPNCQVFSLHFREYPVARSPAPP
jgi:hypothetical protein